METETELFCQHRMHSDSVHKIRLTATYGVAWSVGLHSAGLLVTFVSPAKQLNRSRCRLGDLLRWDQGTMN